MDQTTRRTRPASGLPPTATPGRTGGASISGCWRRRAQRCGSHARSPGRARNRAAVGETTSNFGQIKTTPDTPFDGDARHGVLRPGGGDLSSGLALNLNGRVDDNSGFGTFFTYRAGAVYRLPSQTRIRASVGRAFKAPTFCEQFCNAPFVVGDSTLQPERSTSWEVGLEQELVSQRLSIWATYFDQQFEDLILYDGGAAPGAPTYFNGAAADAAAWRPASPRSWQRAWTSRLRTRCSAPKPPTTPGCRAPRSRTVSGSSGGRNILSR